MYRNGPWARHEALKTLALRNSVGAAARFGPSPSRQQAQKDVLEEKKRLVATETEFEKNIVFS